MEEAKGKGLPQVSFQEKEVEHKVCFNEKGEIVLKKKSNISRGRKSRAAGARFELKVRKDLEKMGWVVDKWTNNVDLKAQEITAARRKFNPFSKIMTVGTGFPDFSGSKYLEKGYDLIGVEVKSQGYLDRDEKEKCRFLLDKKIFSRILIAKKGKKRGKIEYFDFNDKNKQLSCKTSQVF